MMIIYNMNGGKFQISESSLMNRTKDEITQPWVEKVFEKFYLYFDLDFKKYDNMSWNEKDDIMNIIVNNYKNEDVWISKCTEEKGIHIIVRSKIVNRMEAKRIVREFKIDEYLDSSAYNVGLRILFAPKPNEKRCYVPYQRRINGSIEQLDSSKWYSQFFVSLKDNNNILTNTPRRRRSSHGFGIYKMVELKNGKIIFYSRNRNCRNLSDGKGHRSNTIYYELKGNFLIQRCWCRCDTLENRLHGLCKNYRSEKIPIGMLELEQLKTSLKKI